LSFGGNQFTQTAVWLQAKGRECGLELWPRLNAVPVCDADEAAHTTCGTKYVLNIYLQRCKCI